MATLGLIGSGNIGSTLARLAVDAGLDVVLSNSRGPQTLSDLVDELGPRARAATPAQAAAAGDWVVVTIPVGAIGTVPREPLVGKTVIDTGNARRWRRPVPRRGRARPSAGRADTPAKIRVSAVTAGQKRVSNPVRADSRGRTHVMATIEVLDSFMSYRDTGAGDVPVVFLHGNPTSSHLWRNVIPRVADQARCLAPDLIGMGESGKPDIAYRLADHVRYLDAWFDAMGLGEVVIVGHDWGGALGMDWAARHPGRVRGIAVIETFLRPMRWDEMAPQAAELFRAYRSRRGEELVLEQNMFIEVNLVRGRLGELAESDHDVYRAPFPEPAARRPLLAWAREFPLDGEPADVVEVVRGYGRWMAETPDVPKLLLAVENGVGLGSPEVIAWAAGNFASAEVESVGPAGHHAPEDQPEAIGTAIARWLRRSALTAAGVPS